MGVNRWAIDSGVSSGVPETLTVAREIGKTEAECFDVTQRLVHAQILHQADGHQIYVNDRGLPWADRPRIASPILWRQGRVPRYS